MVVVPLTTSTSAGMTVVVTSGRIMTSVAGETEKLLEGARSGVKVVPRAREKTRRKRPKVPEMLRLSAWFTLVGFGFVV